MGQGQLLAAGLALIAAFAPARGAVGQGPLYRERWSDLHLELLRERVLHESRGRDRDTLRRVAELLAEPDGGIAFGPPARALAHLRGVPCDDPFLFRAAVSVFLLPEIVDPEAGLEQCRRLNATLFLPITLPAPGPVTFEVEALDPAGATVHRAEVTADTAVEDLRMARPSAAVPGAELADGRYRLRVKTLFDAEGPRPQDPVLEHGFTVLRGYQARADEARARAAVLAAAQPPQQRALLLGLLGEVHRAYGGEAFEGQSDAQADLERLERALANLGDGRPLLSGMHGRVPVALPTGGEEVLGAVLELPPQDAGPRPLLVIAGGAPAYDPTGRRPIAPASRGARWTARRVGDLGLGDLCHVAWLQSPGGGLPYAKALPVALAALRELLPHDGRTVLVLELHSATAASFAAGFLREHATGVVLVGAGAFPADALQRLGGLRMLGVPLDGHPSSRGLEFTAATAAGEHGAVDWQGRFELVPDRPRPWTFGAAAARSEIEAFVRALLAGR